MEEGINVQKKFFNELKAKLPSNLSMANVVADELGISIDSAYRRIRGESDLSLMEFDILTAKYHISTDAVLSKSFGSVNFDYRCINHENFGFESYFKSLTDEIRSLEQFGLKEIIYCALDLPVFYYFTFPKLAAFKIFFWKRNVFNYPEMANQQLNLELISAGDFEISHNLLKSYLSVPTIEIWSEETLNSTLRQINYYNEMGMFETKQDALDILEDLRKVVEHIQYQAEYGYKFYPETDSPVNGKIDNFKIYHNEITLSENVILLKLENFNVVHLGHNVLNVLTTHNQNFYEDSINFIEKVIKNSTQISISAEKERKRFFNILYHKIDALIANL